MKNFIHHIFRILIFVFVFTTITGTSCKKSTASISGDSTGNNNGGSNDNNGDNSNEDSGIGNLDTQRYIVFFLTNTSIQSATTNNYGKDANTQYNFIEELPHIFGPIKKDSPIKYAFGLPGPMLLTASVLEMKDQINKAFDAAELYDVPVYFQLDDCNNYTTEFGSWASPKFYKNPNWVEWIQFPEDGENWGGQEYGRPPYFWFNWGDWMHAEAFPAFQVQGFRDFVVSQLTRGVISPLKERLNRLKEINKEYLFAGMSVGWETHIPDYSSSNTFLNVKKDNLPIDIRTGDMMQNWEAAKYGYNSLSVLGKEKYDLETLYQVIHDYTELLAKTCYDAGIPRNRIFTHIVGAKSSERDRNIETTFVPAIWTAVNDYSIPGFTMSPITSPYNLETLKSDIRKADPHQNYFVVAEGYARGVDKTQREANNYFSSLFNNGALLVSVFGWGTEPPTSTFAVSHDKNSPFVKAAKEWLEKEELP